MKAQNLLVSIKRAIQTTKSLQETGPWSNLLEDLEISHQDQVWVDRYYLCASQGTLHLSRSAHGRSGTETHRHALFWHFVF